MSAKETGLSEEDRSPEIPFLVTHWLANYNVGLPGKESNVVNPDQEAALDRIRKAASDIASAFAVLGAFGQSLPVSVNSAMKKDDIGLTKTAE